MFFGIEKNIQVELSRLTAARSTGFVREARQVFSPEELAGCSPEQQALYSKITSESRRLEWSEARRCERLIRDRIGQDARTSISHTRHDEVPVVFAVGIAAAGARGIGVDAELRSRSISETASRRFISTEEARLELQPIEIWVTKEALFKANPDNSGSILPNYTITRFDPKARTGRARFKDLELQFFCIGIDEWVVSAAVL